MELHTSVEEEKIIDSLQNWFEENKKMPNKIDRIHLTRFYFCMYKDIEETKKLLTINYSMRHGRSDLFIERDPKDEDTKNTYDFIHVIPLPGLCPKNYRISVLSFKNIDPKAINFTQDVKTVLMIMDCRLSMPDMVVGNTSLIAKGEIIVFDMDGVGMQHIARLSFRTLRVFFKYFLQAYSQRVKAVHLINCPTYLNKMLAVLRPFLSKEIFEMMHFHSNSLDELFKTVPKELLPEEYGGNAGTLDELSKQFRTYLANKRDYLIDPNYWKLTK